MGCMFQQRDDVAPRPWAPGGGVGERGEGLRNAPPAPPPTHVDAMQTLTLDGNASLGTCRRRGPTYSQMILLPFHM